MSLDTTIKSIQDIMRKDVGVSGDAQRIEQLVWLLFLKIWDDRERERELLEDDYVSPLCGVRWREGDEERTEPDLRWRSWAADAEGITGDSLQEFVNGTLFPALKGQEVGPRIGGDRPEEKRLELLRKRQALVRSVFQDTYNYMKSGTLLRQVINKIQESVDFNDSRKRHLFGEIYERILKDLQAAGNAGEYYTPRAVTQFAVSMVAPRLGEVVLDPACGTGGFLTGAIDHVRRNHVKTPEQEVQLHSSIRGVEKKPLPHLLCATNMVVHGIDVPSNVVRDNTLTRPLRDYGARDRVDVVVTNPPFQGMEEEGIEANFPAEVRTRETADLFLALVMHLLNPSGRCAIVLPDSSLFGEGVKEALRRRLLEDCDLHTIIRLPHGVFSPYTDIRTNLLFFDKGGPTEGIWYYDLPCPTGKKYTKTRPISDDDFSSVARWWGNRTETPHSWYVPVEELEAAQYNFDVKNPALRDAAALLRVATDERREAQLGLSGTCEAVREAATGTQWPLGDRAKRLLCDVAAMSSEVSLTSGVLDKLRTALTELALLGEVSGPEEGDESIESTLARFAPSARSLEGARGEPPFELPTHWRWRRLAQLSEFQIGRTPNTRNRVYWEGSANGRDGFAWCSISDMPRRGIVEQTGRRVTRLAVDEVFKGPPAPPGALLMAFKLSVGKTALLGVEAYHNEAIASFQIDDVALRDYLLWALPALASHGGINPAVRGSTLNARSIASLWIPVPPRQEQERIVQALVWGVDLLEQVSGASEALRGSSDVVLKLLAESRALSASSQPQSQPQSR